MRGTGMMLRRAGLGLLLGAVLMGIQEKAA